MSLGLRNIQQVDNNVDINHHFTVTDKADGDGNILYINNQGKIYLIDSNLRCRFTGLTCEEESDSILNGEFISKDINGHFKYSFLLL